MIRQAKMLLSLMAAVLTLPLSAAPASAQEECRGWMRSCASVEVHAEGDRLVLFAPNLPVDETVEGEAPATDEDMSESVEGVAATDGAATMTATHLGNRECRKYESEGDPKSGEERDDCARPLGALFMLAVPTTIYALSPTDGGPTVTGPDGAPVAGPGAGDDDSGDGSSDGSDNGGSADGDGGSGDGAGGSGDDSGGASDGGTSSGDGGSSGDNSTGQGDSGGTGSGDDGSTGGSDGDGGSTGGGNDPAGGSDGSGVNNTGGGSDGGDAGPYHPTAGDLPPISQVPEPISTTLFGLGLAGYGAARLRRRGQEAIEE